MVLEVNFYLIYSINVTMTYLYIGMFHKLRGATMRKLATLPI